MDRRRTPQRSTAAPRPVPTVARPCGQARSPETRPTVRVGVDLASIAAVRASIERFGDRYTHRCFTDREVEACSGSPEVRAASLAARFAAKEATVKALRAGPYGFDWRSVEILRQPDGGCAIALHGSLAELAARDGVGELSVSLTHEGAVAAAVVVALCEPTGHEMFDVAASARRDTAKES